MPGVQKPHWVPLNPAMRLWIGWNPTSLAEEPSPSVVVTALARAATAPTIQPQQSHGSAVRCVPPTTHVYMRRVARHHVATHQPSSDASGQRHELTDLWTTLPVNGSTRDSMTAQAPQPPSPQLSLVPLSGVNRRM